MATAPTDPVPHGARNWSPDELDGFERTTLTMPDASDGPVEVVVVRRCDAPAHAGTRAFLYVHGFGDYFFQQHLADTVQEAGFRFHAVDLRRHGRSLRPHQLPNVTFDVDEYVADVAAAVRLLVDDGVREIVLNGHSTGGLVAVLYAHRGEGREHLSSVVLTSPFLDMNLPAWQERLVEPVLAFAGRFLPKVALGGLCDSDDDCGAGAEACWTFEGADGVRAGANICTHTCQAEADCADVPNTTCIAFQQGQFAVCLPPR